MLKRQLAEFVSSQVIALAVRCGCGCMCVDGKVVQLCGSIMALADLSLPSLNLAR